MSLASAPPPPTSTAALGRRTVVRSIVANIILPLALVEVLLHRGLSPVPALALGAIFPAAAALIGLTRRGRVDPLAIVALTAIVVGVGASFLSGSPVFALAKESLFTFVFGAGCLLSLVAGPRPAIFYLGRQFGEVRGGTNWDERWREQPRFRQALRVLTAIWGVGFLCEAALRIVAALTLPVAATVVVSPLLAIVAILVLIALTRVYVLAVQRIGNSTLERGSGGS